MEATLTAAPSTRARTVGWALTALPALFLTFDAVIKLVEEPHAVAGTADLGFPVELLRTLGAIELSCLVLFLVPRTAFLGALLLTAYLGGAVAAHVRLMNPVATHTLVPVYVAAVCWAGLALRDRRVLSLFVR